MCFFAESYASRVRNLKKEEEEEKNNYATLSFSVSINQDYSQFLANSALYIKIS